MPVLLTTRKGFINAVVEPQFQLGSGTMVTVQFSEYDDVREMKYRLKGDVVFDQHASLFPFTSFIHLDDLVHHFKHKKLWKELTNSMVDFSKPPVAYYWEAYYTGEDSDDGDIVDENTYTGYDLPEEIADARWGFEHYPDVFQVYPLYEMPKELLVEPMANPDCLLEEDLT